MDTLQKINILGTAASYDTVCGSPKSTKINENSLTDTLSSFIYKSQSENNSCNMLKILQTNNCMYDCKYCLNRCSRQKQSVEFEPEELAKSFITIKDKGLVEALFLTSAVAKDPDKATGKMLETVTILRKKYHFNGFIHFKILPGTSYDLVKQASEMCQRLSINIEASNKQRLNELSSNKDFNNDILKRQFWIKSLKPHAGQTTQIIVGSSDETDWEILKTVNFELKSFHLSRFYFSAFSPVKGTPLENKSPTPLTRQNKLYNVEFMLRKYNFNVEEFKLIIDDNNMLPKIDPKIALANKTLDYKVDVNEASYEELIKVPGIGLKTAKKLCNVRTKTKIKKYEHLHKLGISIGRAKPYIKVNGMSQKQLIEF